MRLGNELPRGAQRVDVCRGLVATDAVDAGKAEGDAAGVEVVGLDGCEGHLEDDLWAYVAGASILPKGAFVEVCGELYEVFIGEAAMGFSDWDEGAGFIVAQG